MNIIPVTCALILNETGQILVVQRSRSMKPPLKWEFPGGKIEAGETPEACLIREIQEELNVTIEILEPRRSHVYHYPALSIQLMPFIARIVSGQIVLQEHAQFQWVDKLTLSQLDWAEADIPIVQDYLNTSTFSLL